MRVTRVEALPGHPFSSIDLTYYSSRDKASNDGADTARAQQQTRLKSGIAEQVLQELGKHGGGSLEDCAHHKHQERAVFVSRFISHQGDKE
jgi:hypothetical protein